MSNGQAWGISCDISPHVAAYEGDIILLESLVYTEYDTNLKDQNGATPLHHAAFGGFLDCLTFLLENGALVDAVDNEGSTALHIACYQGHLSCVKALLTFKANVHLVDNEGHTPLHKATLYNHEECVAHVLTYDSNVDARTPENKTALHFAAQLGYAGCLLNLLKANAEVNLVDGEKRTALHIAALYGFVSCITHLLEYRADLCIQDATGATALHNAAYKGFDQCVELLAPVSRENIKKDYLDMGDEDGITALHHVAYSGNFECLECLLKAGSSAFVLDNRKYTPLHLAASEGHTNCVNALLENLKQQSSRSIVELISAQSDNGVTPLHLACLEGQIESVKLLLSFGADVNRVDGEGASALHKAAFKGSEECIQALIQSGCSVNLQDNDGDTALHKAAYGGFDECVDVLIQNHADIDARDNHQAIPAHNAASTGQVSCLDKLINEKNINTDDCKGYTPLHVATINGQLEAVQYLITKPNINPNCTDARGHTPLYHAIDYSFEGIVHELILEGVEIDQNCKELVSLQRVLISPATIERFIEEKKNREKMKDRMDPKTRTVIRQLVAIFNTKPKKGLQALIDKGVVGKSPDEIAEFLHNNELLDKKSIGELLGEEEFHELRRSFTDYMHFEGMEFEPALRRYLSTFRLPGEAQKIDRLMECFADRYYSQNDTSGIFADKDACYILAFAVIMLNTDAHNPAIKKANKMTKQQFFTNNRGINAGGDIDPEYLGRIYDGIVEEEIKMDAEHSVFTNAEKKGYLTKQGGRVKTWKKRWFVLTNNNLYYFRNRDQEKNPCGWIPLENLKIITETNKSSKQKYTMIIQSAIPGSMIKSCKLVDGQPVPGSHSRFVIATSTAEEMKEWCDTINASMQKNPFLNVIQDKLKAKGGTAKQAIINKRRTETTLNTVRGGKVSKEEEELAAGSQKT